MLDEGIEPAGKREQVDVMQYSLVVALTVLVSGCTQMTENATPIDFLGVLANAPIVAPILALGADEQDIGTSAPELQSNPRALEGQDAHSQQLALRNLAYVLEQGRPRARVYWENPANNGGRAGGVATLARETKDDKGRSCREVVIETELEGEPTDKRMVTFCRSETGWRRIG